MSMKERAWPPRTQWDSMHRGEDCPMCAQRVERAEVDDYGYTIAEMPSGALRLAIDQFVLGYSVLVCNQHGPEPYSLSDEDGAAFMRDVTVAGRAIERAFSTDKMNFLILGNAVPHLHCHFIPRYHGDPEPGRPLLTGPTEVRVSDAEYRDRVARIRAGL